MSTADKTPAAAAAPAATQKRAYQTPEIVDLGDVRELTRGGGGSKFDGPGNPGKP